MGQWIVGVISFQKIFGLCGLKGHIVEIRWDVTIVHARTMECEDSARILKQNSQYQGQSLVSTAELLKQCNYMSVKQMAFYYSVAAVHKLLVNKQPEYLHQVVCEALASGTKHRYPTSAAGKQPVKPAKLMMANTSFRWRASADYANLPLDLKEEKNLK